MCRFGDGDCADVSNGGTRTARKPHRCSDCQRTIQPGERYEWGKWLYDGVWSGAKQCVHCRAAGVWLHHKCGGYLWTEILEELEEHWRDEPSLRTFKLAKLICLMRCRWRDGTFPVERVRELVAA